MKEEGRRMKEAASGEGQTMTSLLSGFSAQPARGPRLLAAIIAALHETRSSAIFYFLKNIVIDLSDRPYTLRQEISNMFVENLLSFITEKPEELQSSIALIRDTIRGIPTNDEATRSTRNRTRHCRRADGLRCRFALNTLRPTPGGLQAGGRAAVRVRGRLGILKQIFGLCDGRKRQKGSTRTC